MGNIKAETPDELKDKSVTLPELATNRKHLVSQDLMIIYQNIRSLSHKTDEILNTLESNPPHLICFTEHHLKSYQLDNIYFFHNYQLGAEFCRKRYKNDGVCIFIHEYFQFCNINVYKFCKEKYFVACVIKLYLSCCAIGIVSIYRSPSRNFEYFLDKLDCLLNFVKGNSMELTFCGDFNINFFK